MNNPVTFHIEPSQIRITPGMIAKLIGSDPENIPEPYNQIINTELEQLKNYQDICGGYLLFNEIELNQVTKSLIAGSKNFSIGKQVFHYLKEAEKAAFFICTAGASVSKRAEQQTENGEILEAYITDVIGSTIVEKAMDIVQQNLAHEMQMEGLAITNRYSPGYCDWNVIDQHKLFHLFPENFCGVLLSENAMMNPVKSISGVIGIGTHVKYNEYVCEACTSVNCIYRNVRHTV